MSAGPVAAALLALAALDGALAGFRSSAGRTGLIRRRRRDLLAAARGGLTGLVLLAPVVVVVLLQVAADPGRTARHLRAGQLMLAVYLPYGALVLLALACYSLLGWRRRFLAEALVLGPFTLARPAVALGGALAGAWASHDVAVAAAALASGLAVLAVQPVVDRLWYAPRRGRHPDPVAGRRPVARPGPP